MAEQEAPSELFSALGHGMATVRVGLLQCLRARSDLPDETRDDIIVALVELTMLNEALLPSALAEVYPSNGQPSDTEVRARIKDALLTLGDLSIDPADHADAAFTRYLSLRAQYR